VSVLSLVGLVVFYRADEIVLESEYLVSNCKNAAELGTATRYGRWR